MLFKKAQLTEKIEPFIEKIKPHYFKSKVFYAERKINYKNFVTIVRQMCKAYAIGFVSSKNIVNQNMILNITYSCLRN